MSDDNQRHTLPRRVKFFLEFLAIMAFALALYLLWLDNTSSAGVAVALGFGALLFRMLPILESFEILGLKAKLRERLEEAEEILRRLRGIATVNSKTSILIMTYANRWNGLSFNEQAGLLEEQANLLLGLGVSQMDVRDVKTPALAMLSHDLVRIFQTALELAQEEYGKPYGRLRERVRTGTYDLDTDLAERTRQIAERRQKDYSYSVTHPMFDDIYMSKGDVGGQLDAILDSVRLSQRDKSNLSTLVGEIKRLDREIWNESAMTSNARDFLEKHDKQVLTKELVFPDGIEGPDWSVEEECGIGSPA